MQEGMIGGFILGLGMWSWPFLLAFPLEGINQLQVSHQGTKS